MRMYTYLYVGPVTQATVGRRVGGVWCWLAD